MALLSQNGWPANQPLLIHVVPVPGTMVRLPVRVGVAGALLIDLAARFAAKVEPLMDPGCWGFAERPVRGGTDLSNHASGTAIDLNAPRHPLGTDPRASFSNVQIARIRAIVDSYDGLIRWGGDYAGRKDPMHFEIVGTPGRCAAFYARLHAPAPPVGDDDPMTPQEFAALLRDPAVRAEIAEIVWTEREFGREPNRVTSEGLLVKASTPKVAP